jgi:hypothetical protein
MAERRVLCLLGPCRVDGAGGCDGDLRGLDGVDTAGHSINTTTFLPKKTGIDKRKTGHPPDTSAPPI